MRFLSYFAHSSPPLNHGWLAAAFHKRYRLLLTLILLLGCVVRLAHLALVDLDLPYHLGGLYAEFAFQIAQNDFRLPTYIPFYTDHGMPFAYPPLSFYLLAAARAVLPLSAFTASTLLPPLLSLLVFLSYAVFLQQVIPDRVTRLLPLLTFAIVPAAFMQQVEGAGLAEVTGSLTLAWLLASLVRTWKRPSPFMYGLAGIFWALSVLASPGSAYASVITVLIFAVCLVGTYGRGRIGHSVLGLGITGGSAVLVAGPFFLNLANHHGLAILLTVFQDQHKTTTFLRPAGALLGLLPLSHAPNATLFDGLILTGLLYTLVKRQWVLFAWAWALISIPREGQWLASFAVPILTALAITEVFVPIFKGASERHLTGYEQRIVGGGLVLLIVGFLIGDSFLSVYKKVQQDCYSLPRDTVVAMEWIAASAIPDDSRFVVFHRCRSPQGENAVLEWFPHVSRRTLLNTNYGSEWEPAERRQILQLNDHLASCTTLDCVYSSTRAAFNYAELYLLTTVALPSGGGVTFESLYQNRTVTVGVLSGGD